MPFVDTTDLQHHVWVSKRGLHYSFYRASPPNVKGKAKLKYLGVIVERDNEAQTIKLNTGRIIFKNAAGRKKN